MPPATASPPSAPRGARLARRRRERGLASHEWLLIIAAVAGFGALTLFVLTETVGDSVDRAGADDPSRLASARRAAALVENEAVTVSAGEQWPLRHWGEWEDHFTGRCRNVANAYRIHGITVNPDFEAPKRGGTREDDRKYPMVKADGRLSSNTISALATANPNPLWPTEPKVSCEVVE